MSHAVSRPHRAFLPIGIIIAVMSALLAFGIASVASPSDVLGATVSKTAKCNANVRTRRVDLARVAKP